MEISHLFYADDVLLFCRGNEKEANNLMEILQDYGDMSGQVPNLNKSGLFFSKHASRSLKHQIPHIIIIEVKVSNIT